MHTKTALRIALVAAAAVASAACSQDAGDNAQRSGATVSQKIDKAIDRTQERLAAAGEKTQQTLAETSERLQPKLDAAGDRIASAADKTAANVKEVVRGKDGGGNGSPAATNGSGTTPSGRPAVTTTVTTGPSTSIKGLPEGTRTAVADTAITTAIKAQFLKDPDLSVIRIDVDTNDGIVVLNGVADTDAARQRATRIAQSVRGVKEVRNHLTAKQG